MAIDRRFERVDNSHVDADEVVRPNISFWQDAARRLKKNKVSMTALVVLAVLIVLSFLVPTIGRIDYITMDVINSNQGPSAAHWFGTDTMGRDMLGRICVATRVSLAIALVATFVQMVIGSIYGAVAAYAGGFIDEILMRIVEVINSIPSLILTLLILAVIGNSVPALMLALCISSWTGTARMVRGKVLQLRESEYVLASATLGASTMRIIVKHLLPNTIGLLILDVASSIPAYINYEAVLSFLGLGLQSPSFSLGTMISLGQSVMTFYPYQLMFPMVVLCVLILAFNLLGDGLRDALDPSLRD